jgi:hypothetical protein
MTDERMCTWCHKPILETPSYEFSRVTKGRRLIFLPKTIYQSFPFHTKSEIVAWINRAKQVGRSNDQ